MATGYYSQIDSSQAAAPRHLRSLARAILGVGALAALMFAIGPIASAALAFFLVLIGLHVAGNVIGTSLRDSVPGSAPEESLEHEVGRPRLCQSHSEMPVLGACSRLSHLVPLATVAGAVAGRVIGILYLPQWTNAQPAGIMIGSYSFGVLGALLGFMIGGFLEMSLRAWRQALRASEPIDLDAVDHRPLTSAH